MFVEALVTGIVGDITALRTAPLPTRSAAPPAAPEPARSTAAPAATPAAPDPQERCSAGDERLIVAVGNWFSVHWNNRDHEALGALWSTGGDIVHPDGAIERGAQAITINRMRLFARREYRSSRHPLTLTRIRCLSADIAIADGKWELRGVLDASGKPLPAMEGLVTMVLKRAGGWLIEGYRYTITPAPPAQTSPAPLPNRPGGPGGLH